MRATLFITLTLLCAPLAAVAQPAPGNHRDASGVPVVMASDADPEVNAAIAEARRTLPEVWRRMAQRGPGESGLKVALRTSRGGYEHIWVDSIVRQDGRITARLANDPDNIPGLKLGSPVVVDPAAISDWSYRSGGRLYGHFTTRVLLKRASPEEAQQIQALLSPTPLEPDAR